MFTQAENGTYVGEISSLPGYGVVDCPQCHLPLLKRYLTHTDMDDGELLGWCYTHSCGAKILLIND